VAVDLPKLYNPVTNLLGPQALPQPRQPKHRRRQRELAGDGAAAGEAQEAGAAAGAGLADAAGVAAAAAAGQFVPASKWGGRRPGFAFKLGHLGLGYYPDHGLAGAKAAGAAAAAAAGVAAEPAGGSAAEGAPGSGGTAAPAGGGWVPMKTVADLRRALGVGAPRDSGGPGCGAPCCLRAGWLLAQQLPALLLPAAVEELREQS
jgi:hypothetical protein